MDFWERVVSASSADLAVTPLALGAFAAWRAGDGARANIAVTHAIESDPENSLTRLLALLVGQTQVPPSMWPSDALDEITEAAAVHALGDAPN